MKKIILLASLALSINAFAQVPNYVPANGLLGWWPFDGNTLDASGNGNTFIGAASYTSGHLGNSNSAINNFQTSSPLTCATPNFTIAANSAFSISAWVRLTNANASGFIIKNGNQALPWGDFMWFMPVTTSNCAMVVGEPWTRANYVTTIPINSWVHIVGTYNNGAIKTYYNGVLVATQTFSNFATTSSVRPLHLGYEAYDNTVATNIDIDDIGIWNRAISQQEITVLYNANNNVGINEFSKDNLFSVFPNPAQSVINIKADSRLIGSTYSILDNTGRTVLQGKIVSENTTIELSNLSSGVYLFGIGAISKQTFRVIKN